MLFIIGALLVIAMVLYIMYVMGRFPQRHTLHYGQEEDALEILRRRYAEGELTTEEYQKMRRTLEGEESEDNEAAP